MSTGSKTILTHFLTFLCGTWFTSTLKKLPIINLFFAMKKYWIGEGNLFRDFFYKRMPDIKREIMMMVNRQGWLMNMCKFDNIKIKNHRIIES